jgi:hypothetical protein
VSASAPPKKESRGLQAYRLRAVELRRLATRPEPSSIAGALLAAAREWDILADHLARKEDPGAGG